jgi:aryl-alcohol dehydrogenase-like predicted oxidoreductase
MPRRTNQGQADRRRRGRRACSDPRSGCCHTSCAERATTEDAIALAAALAQPWADVVLSRATDEQLESNLAARTLTWDSELE